jgi:hypothetical protein
MVPIRIVTRTAHLTRYHGVAQKNVTGAYDTSPLRELEFLFHEVAHWLVLGNSHERLPRRLSAKIEARMRPIPPASSNSLEIDASMVTFLAGFKLGLWVDPRPIVRSCRRNLRGRLAFEEDAAIFQQFTDRWQASQRTYDDLSHKLAKWFRPSAKLLPTSPATIGV